MLALLLFMLVASSLHVRASSYLLRSNRRVQILSMSSTSFFHAQRTVLVPIATGTEEIEAVTIIDTLVRAGAKVTVANANADSKYDSEIVTCSRGVKLVADCPVSSCLGQSWDAIILPGGMPGATNLNCNEHLAHLLKQQRKDGLLYGAICAAPAVVLAAQGLLQDRKATCYPAEKFSSMLPSIGEGRVVVDQNCVTSAGPGTSLEFSLEIVKLLYGEEKKQALAKEMLLM